MNKKINFDYDKGIIYQIYSHPWEFDDYYQFINEPKHLVNPVRDVRMFDTQFFEMFSKTPVYYIPIAFSPLAYYLFTSMILQATPLVNLCLVMMGIVWWSFSEYVLHRFVFHGEDTWMKKIPLNGLWYSAHFMIHGIHHAFP